MPSSVVWTKTGSTEILTWANGSIETNQEDYKSYVLFDRLADGEIDAEDLGLTEILTRHYTFRNVDLSTRNNFKAWRKLVCIGPLNTFTQTDNSQTSPEALTVRLVDSGVRRLLTPGLTPIWEVNVSLQVEPSTST